MSYQLRAGTKGAILWAVAGNGDAAVEQMP